MRPWTRWLYLVAGLVAAFVAVSAVALAIRQGSWAPIASVGWIPAVIVATAGSTRRRCRPRRGGGAGSAGWAVVSAFKPLLQVPKACRGCFRGHAANHGHEHCADAVALVVEGEGGSRACPVAGWFDGDFHVRPDRPVDAADGPCARWTGLRDFLGHRPFGTADTAGRGERRSPPPPPSCCHSANRAGSVA